MLQIAASFEDVESEIAKRVVVRHISDVHQNGGALLSEESATGASKLDGRNRLHHHAECHGTIVDGRAASGKKAVKELTRPLFSL